MLLSSLKYLTLIVATFTAGYARSTGPSHMVSSHMVPFYSPTWRNGENIRGKLPVYPHMFNLFCGPNSLLPYLELHSRLYCSLKCMKAKLQKAKTISCSLLIEILIRVNTNKYNNSTKRSSFMPHKNCDQ